MRCPTLAELPPPPSGKAGWPWTEESEQLPETMPAQFEVEGMVEDGSSFVIRRSSAPVHRPSSRAWPKISIVTPSYNQGQFIEETIRSVLLQGYPNLEYMVIDGGSDDGSVDIIKKYEPWLAYWVSEPDRGQSHAINKGFNFATGEVLAWLNSDDVYAQEALRKVAVEFTNRTSKMVVGTSLLTNDPTKGLPGKLDERHPSIDEMVYDGCSFPQPSVFWTVDLWNLTEGLNEDYHLAMDYDLWLRMREYAEIVFLKVLLSYARTHPNQKARRLRRKGKETPSMYEKSDACLKAMKRRGETVMLWLIKSYGRRVRKSLKFGKVSMLKPSTLQRLIVRNALRSMWHKPLTV